MKKSRFTDDANNRLRNLGATNLSYDANGNQTSSPTGSPGAYTWNTRDQLVATSAGSTFGYDAVGRMASQTTNGVTSAIVMGRTVRSLQLVRADRRHPILRLDTRGRSPIERSN